MDPNAPNAPPQTTNVWPWIIGLGALAGVAYAFMQARAEERDAEAKLAKLESQMADEEPPPRMTPYGMPPMIDPAAYAWSRYHGR